LHDVGHGPFSHVSEGILDKYSDIKKGSIKEKIHEKITERLINNDAQIKKLLSKQDRDEVIGLLSGGKIDLKVMREIVSGPIDADKIDYLLRDSFFCGVKYGIFDHQQMLSTFTSFDDQGDKYLALNISGKNVLEQFILAKYYMTTQVYRHKVRAISDAMIMRGLELGIEEDEAPFLIKLYKYKDTAEYLNNYLSYWDDRVISEIIYGRKKGYAKTIFDRLTNRVLFKRVFSEKYTELNLSAEIKDKLVDITKKEQVVLRKELEEAISKIRDIKCDKHFVILNKRSIKSIRDLSQKSEGEIIFIKEDGKKASFSDESEVYASTEASVKEEVYLEIYAPLNCGMGESKKIASKIKQDIYNILNKIK
jgi:HD superfamily phosphohydrolase